MFDGKVWFIKIGDEEFGPFSIKELKVDVRITPETLVRRKNWTRWVAIKNIAQLKDVFADDKDEKEEEEIDKKKVSDVLTITLEPKYIFWWVLLILLLVLYLIIRIYD